jgi:hypothetical protein
MTMKEIQERLVSTLKRWQKIEDESVLSTAEVISETDSPILRTVMEVIQRDSQNHRWVQGLLIQGHEKEGFRLTIEDLTEMSKMLERHVLVERRMMEAVNEALEMIKGKSLVIHEYFLSYLDADEKKHMAMLEGLDQIKKRMHPVGPSA